MPKDSKLYTPRTIEVDLNQEARDAFRTRVELDSERNEALHAIVQNLHELTHELTHEARTVAQRLRDIDMQLEDILEHLTTAHEDRRKPNR